MTTAAEAAVIPVVNPSFETPGTADQTFSGSMTVGPSGWTVYNAGATNGQRYFGVWRPGAGPSYYDPVPNGLNVGVVFLENTSNFAEAGLRQTVAATLQPLTEYLLTVEVGNFAPSSGAGWDFTGFPGYRVDLMAGTTVLASDNNSLVINEGRFETSTVSFTTGATHALLGQSLAIRLVNLNGGSSGPAGIEVNFDQVALTAVAVPEPSSVLLFSLGGLFVVALRRRKTTAR